MPKRDLIRDSVKHSVLFARHVVPATVKPARKLWNELIGFLFIVFAFGAAASGVDTAIHFDGAGASVVKLVLISVFSLIMGWYGLASFRKAKRISRS